jgi:hypothetical protein
MTHDEIISDLNKYVMLVEEAGMPATAKMAAIIRAVVELHKPEPMITNSYCIACTINLETVSYPCPTIQAIEKELG